MMSEPVEVLEVSTPAEKQVESVETPKDAEEDKEPGQEPDDPKKTAESSFDAILAQLSEQNEIDLSKIDLPSPEELAEGYIRENMGAPNRETTSTRKGAETKGAGNHLVGNNAVIYSKLDTYISEVAAGSRSKTSFNVTAAELGWSWTAKQLGVSNILSDGSLTEEAAVALSERISFDAGCAPTSRFRLRKNSCPTPQNTVGYVRAISAHFTHGWAPATAMRSNSS